MSLQLIASREPLATKDPVTDKWPLASVPAQVCPQVGRLAVHLPTALHVTDVLFLFCRVPAVPARHAQVRKAHGPLNTLRLKSHILLNDCTSFKATQLLGN